MCDWDGDGIDTPGVFLNGTWYLTNATTGGLSQTGLRLRQPR